MAKRYVALATVAMFATGFASTALAGQTGPAGDLVPLGQQQFFNDPPMSHLNALEFSRRGADTTYYGGVSGDGYTANQVVGDGGSGVAIWDFEDGTLQGWTSIDLTDIPVYVRSVTAATFVGSPASGLMSSGGSTGSLWFGAVQSEAEAGCWPGGMGYSNGWGMRAGKTLSYGGGNVALSFDYFVDSETQFDFTYVYVIQQGVTSDPLNTSGNPNPDTGLGYSGGGFEGTPIGSPTAPESESLTIDASNFPFGAGIDYELQFNFDSDPLFSDGLDSFTAGYYDSEFGAFGCDNILVDGVDQGTFEGGAADGWDFKRDTVIGKLIAVRDLADLDPIADPCQCPLSEGDNQYVMIAANVGGSSDPHPKKQHEELQSNPAYVGGGTDNTIGMLWSAWADNPFDAGVGYRRGIQYYPWTCPETGVVGWTLELAGPGGYTFTDPASCGRFIQDFSTFYAPGSDSVKIAIDFLGDCDDFGVDECIGPLQTNQTPYLDDIQLWTVGSALAPALSIDLTYGDVFPQANSLLPNSAVDVHTWYDNNRADSDQTNANMGDSAVVLAGTQANTRVFLNFRVYPGPETNTGDAFFSRYGGNFIADGVAPDPFAKARMDSAETDSGVQAGLFSTYLHESEGGVEGSATYKLIADGVLTPGTTVEYFFSGDFGAGQPEDVNPDTTGGFFLEWEALPGYFNAGSDILGPCVLYVDAFNNGAQVPIEEFGLQPYLGSVTDDNGLVHQGWDRYDYIGGGNNTPAPLAREASGDNGMTKYQSLFYETILYNTGSNAQEGLRDGDADLLINWLTTDDLDRDLVTKGLWLSGNGMANILQRTGRTDSNLLLSGFAKASLVCDTYRDPGCGGGANGDSSYCVRLDPVAGANFGTAVTYSAASRNGCPTLNAFNVIDALGGGVPGQGNLDYVDQDDTGEPSTSYASVSVDNLGGTNPYGVVLDAFSLHYMRRVADGYTGSTRESCETLAGPGGSVEDSTAITTRVSDVFTWFGLPTGNNLCDYEPIVVSTGDPSSSPIAKTLLFQNTPNPFNPRTTVRYQLAAEAQVSLQIFDVTGKLVKTLVNEVQAPESYSITWDGSTDTGSAVSSGVYWARMSTSNGFKASTKMVVLK